MRCPACGGRGKTDAGGQDALASVVCAACLGTGKVSAESSRELGGPSKAPVLRAAFGLLAVVVAVVLWVQIAMPGTLSGSADKASGQPVGESDPVGEGRGPRMPSTTFSAFGPGLPATAPDGSPWPCAVYRFTTELGYEESGIEVVDDKQHSVANIVFTEHESGALSDGRAVPSFSVQFVPNFEAESHSCEFTAESRVGDEVTAGPITVTLLAMDLDETSGQPTINMPSVRVRVYVETMPAEHD